MWFFVAGHLQYLQSSQSSVFVNYLWWDCYRLWRCRQTILCQTEALGNACLSSIGQACVWNITPVWLPCKPVVLIQQFAVILWKRAFEDFFESIAQQKLHLTHITVNVFLCDLALFSCLAKYPFGAILLSYSLWCLWRCVLTISQLMCIFKLVVTFETWDNSKWMDWEIQV